MGSHDQPVFSWRTRDRKELNEAESHAAASWSAPVLWRFGGGREMNHGWNLSLDAFAGKAVEDYRTPRRWRDEDRSVQFMGGVSEARENDHGSHGWNGENSEQRLSPSEPSVVRNLLKSEFINQKSEILVSLVIDDRDAVYPLTIDPVL